MTSTPRRPFRKLLCPACELPQSAPLTPRSPKEAQCMACASWLHAPDDGRGCPACPFNARHLTPHFDRSDREQDDYDRAYRLRSISSPTYA